MGCEIKMKKEESEDLKGWADFCHLGYYISADLNEMHMSFIVHEDHISYRHLGQKPFLTGYIKWDGCSNWDCQDQVHFCGKKEAMSSMKNFQSLIEKLYDYTAELMPEYKKYLETYGD